jgi:uncharacterized protein (DUF736 family)
MFVRIDVPGDCGLTGWLEELGLLRVDTVIKMVRNRSETHPDDPDFRQYGIINQAVC